MKHSLSLLAVALCAVACTSTSGSVPDADMGVLGPPDAGTGGSLGGGTGGHSDLAAGGAVGSSGGAAGAVASGTGGGASPGDGGIDAGAGGSTAAGGTTGTGGRGGATGVGGAASAGGTAGMGATAGTGGTIGTGGAAGMGGASGAVGTGGVQGTGGAVQGTCSGCTVTNLPIAAVAAVYDPIRNRIYASVQGDAPAYPNTIVAIDPSTLPGTSAVVWATPIGSNPATLTLSQDASTLWVAIRGAHAYRTVTLGTTPPTVGPLQHLPRSSPDSRYFFDELSAVALPDGPLSIAMLISDGAGTGQVEVLDDGIARPAIVSRMTTASTLVGGADSQVFGVNQLNDFFVMAVSANGISQTMFEGRLDGYASKLVYSNGRVFTDTGEAIDVSNPAAPARAGRFPASGPIALRDGHSALILANDFSGIPATPAKLHLVSTDTLADILQIPLPASVPAGLTARLGNLVYAGGDAVAFSVGINSDPTRLVMMHVPALGPPNGGSTQGTGGSGGSGGAGGGSIPSNDACTGCSFTTLPAYGRRLAYDAGRNLVYVTADATAVDRAGSIVTVDLSSASVASAVPVGPDPLPIALSQDGTALWVATRGDGMLHKVTPGATPTVGSAFPLGDLGYLEAMAALPDGPSALVVSGSSATIVLDDGLPRAGLTQPLQIGAAFLAAGPPGVFYGIDPSINFFQVYQIQATALTVQSFGGLVLSNPQTGLAFSGGNVYLSQGEVIDVNAPANPVPAGRFDFNQCVMAVRSSSRILMLCTNPALLGPILRVLDANNFAPTASATVPVSLLGYLPLMTDFAYAGGDTVALMAEGQNSHFQLYLMHFPIVGAPP